MNALRGFPGSLWPAAACLATLCLFCVCAHFGTAVWGNDDPREAVYNRMADGFAKGQLSLDREVPPGFARLRDPYDPEQNSPYRVPPYFLYDLSYYRGKIYAYFGPMPALLLFGPFHLLTGHYLSYKAAAVLLCSLGFLAAAWVLSSARRRYAAAAPPWLMAVLVLAVGLATGVPTLLARVDVWEIPIAGATALTLCAVAALWQAWHQEGRRAGWLAAASLGLGLAVGTRPTALLNAPILLLPLLLEWRENRWARGGKMLAAAALPLLVCLGALAAYNQARFGNPLEFGQSYILATGVNAGKIHQFGLAYVWDNVRMNLLDFTPWKREFPFVGGMPKVTLHGGHAEPEFTFGILGNVPIVWMALAAVALRGRRDGLAFLGASFLWIAGVQTALLMLYLFAVSRYEVEFLAPLVCLAAVGLLASEAGAGRRPLLRGAWIALAAVSVAFNLCHAATRAARARQIAGSWFVGQNEPGAALEHYEVLLALEPPSSGLRNARGIALAMLARWGEAAAEFGAAVRLDPANANAQCNLGVVRLAEGKPAEAIGALRESLRLNPDQPRARAALERALQAAGP
jgi:hypothetical protein